MRGRKKLGRRRGRETREFGDTLFDLAIVLVFMLVVFFVDRHPRAGLALVVFGCAVHAFLFWGGFLET